MEMNYEEETLHRIEHELHVQIYPGTEIMTDVGSLHFVKARGKTHRVLIPQPTADPHDPLNWKRFWKASAMFWSIFAAFTQGFGPLAIAPMVPELMEAFDADLAAVLQFTGVCILVLGFSTFVWMPLHNSLGRRPVMLLSTMVCLVSNIWRAKAATYGSFMGACALSGVGASPAETLIPVSITDVMFLHERGFYQTLYFTAYYTSAMSGTIIGGAMANNVGWRNFWWFNVAILALTMVGLICFFPETRYPRMHATEHHHREQQAGRSDKQAQVVRIEKAQVGEPPASEEPQDPALGKGSPSWQQLMPCTLGKTPIKTTLMDFFIPWKMSLFPIVDLSALIVGWSSSSFLTTNLTQTQVFAAPPYSFSSGKIGLFNFAPMVGALIGLATNGYFSDWVSMVATKRNRYIREPEMRLPAMIPYALVAIFSNFIIAFGYQYKWNWKVIVFVGYTCSGMQVAAIPAIASNYAVDSYKVVAGSLFVVITVLKNLWCYGLSKWLTPFITSSGYVKPIMLNMCLYVFWLLCSVGFYYRGKTFRKWTAKSAVHDH